jgi:hypothetical protein
LGDKKVLRQLIGLRGDDVIVLPSVSTENAKKILVVCGGEGGEGGEAVSEVYSAQIRHNNAP